MECCLMVIGWADHCWNLAIFWETTTIYICTQGLRDGGKRGASYTSPTGAMAQEDESRHAKCLCKQAQIY